MTARRRHAGIGLVDMLVALALGLFVALAAAAMLLLANRDFTHQAAATRLDDGGRYAVELLGRAIRQAAWTDLEAGAPPADAAASIGGLDDRTLPRMAAGLDGALRAGAVQRSDVLAVHFGGLGGAGGDGSVVDCAGFAIGAGEAGWSIFYVGTADDGETELRCKYRAQSGNWNADAVVRGVDSFQVLYGLDTDQPPDGIPNRYLNASGIRALDAALVLAGATPAEQAHDLRRKTHWKRIAVVRVALLLHGDAQSRTGSLPMRYHLFGTPGEPDDPGTMVDEAALPAPLRWRVRRLFDGTVLLRNRAD
ncbi:PilW family protein [Pseudoduganella umbonata]|uniref:Pilus assembly protein PilW n=1 Tax=Pseudoduganella umbonata TaxID=864828 RepID=A0A4P8HVK8_9BURK|nr:PilW family protein [Pseudoduganella umbonata]MBB3224136.1 type IV pilus assembly protein PilW [Pseudoduganella umbonata]QCP14003.1 pilus assembly protein PilW [Pseudoduganella umbonata]